MSRRAAREDIEITALSIGFGMGFRSFYSKSDIPASVDPIMWPTIGMIFIRQPDLLATFGGNST
jgi:hypothetical protein